MKRLLPLLALLAAPLHAQSVLPQLSYDKGSGALRLRDPATGQPITIGTNAGGVFSAPAVTQVIGGNPTYPSTFYTETGADPNNATTNTRLAVTSTGTHTGTRYASTIEVRAQGSGTVSCPQCADYGLGISTFKTHWDKLPTDANHPIAGEMDGITIWARQADGDYAGLLADIQTHRAYAAVVEGGVTTLTDVGAPISRIHSYVAANSGYIGDTLTAKGFATLCDIGACDVAYYGGPNGGAFQYFLFNDTGGSHVPNFTVAATNGNLTSSGSGTFASDVSARNVITAGNLEVTGFIDFHTTGTPNDYDCRLSVSGGTQGTVGKGMLVTQCAGINATAIKVGSGGLTLTEVSAGSVTAPASGTQTIFIDSADHKLKREDSSGAVTIIG